MLIIIKKEKKLNLLKMLKKCIMLKSKNNINMVFMPPMNTRIVNPTLSPIQLRL